MDCGVSDNEKWGQVGPPIPWVELSYSDKNNKWKLQCQAKQTHECVSIPHPIPQNKENKVASKQQPLHHHHLPLYSFPCFILLTYYHNISHFPLKQPFSFHLKFLTTLSIHALVSQTPSTTSNVHCSPYT